METDRRSPFISSVTRRDLARRRAARHVLRLQLLLAIVVLVAAIGVILASRGGV